MALTVGVDTYVSLEDAETLAANHMLSSDKAYKFWLELSNSDKEVLLRNSCRSIDNLKFDGRRKELSQILEFPRVNQMPSGIGYRLYIGQLYDNGLYASAGGDGGLSLVRQAQVINAVYAGYYNELATKQIAINIQGLTSRKTGPISESYNKTRNGAYSSVSDEDALRGIFTPKVYALLTPWLNSSRITY